MNVFCCRNTKNTKSEREHAKFSVLANPNMSPVTKTNNNELDRSELNWIGLYWNELD